MFPIQSFAQDGEPVTPSDPRTDAQYVRGLNRYYREEVSRRRLGYYDVQPGHYFDPYDPLKQQRINAAIRATEDPSPLAQERLRRRYGSGSAEDICSRTLGSETKE